jgi:hypothetical protein
VRETGAREGEWASGLSPEEFSGQGGSEREGERKRRLAERENEKTVSVTKN